VLDGGTRAVSTKLRYASRHRRRAAPYG
jgi:hypothetical protein